MADRTAAHRLVIANERVKLHASLTGNVAVFLIAFGGVEPFLTAAHVFDAQLSVGTVIVGVGAWFAASGFLGRLDEELGDD